MNDRKGLIAVIVITGLFLFLWTPTIRFIENRTGVQLLPREQPQEAAATQPTENPSPATMPGFTALPTTGPSGSSASTQTVAAGVQVAPAPATQPMRLVVGSGEWKDKTYALALDVTPTGGGLAEVELNDYAEQVGTKDPFTFQLPINGAPLPLSTKSVTLTLDLLNDGKPLATLFKTFTLEPRDATPGALGYDTTFAFGCVNHTAGPLTVSSIVNGPTFLPSDQLRGGDRSVVAGYQGKNAVILRHDPLEGFTGANATKDFTHSDDGPLLWIGAGGNYFNAIVRPTGSGWVKTASASVTNPDQQDTTQRQVAIELTTNDFVLPPGATLTNTAKVYFGPRKREILNNPYYAAPGLQYGHTLESSGYCALCTFQWLVSFLMTLLGVFEFIFRDWGLAIIALVFVVRTCLHPITKRAQINMAKMGKMGPEIEKIKKKYGDDKEGMNKAMMEFYKTQGATPILGCLPMFLQMPIWIALYSGLGSTFELRQAPFLYGLTWIHDLSKPDHLIAFARPIQFFFLHIDGLNVIPILLAGAFFLQQKFTPKPPASTPEQEQQQKMMQWMSLLFPVMLYSSPSGLNLYILTSTTFGIIESRIIRKHIKEREAQAAAGPTFVDDEDDDRTLRRTTGAGAVVAKPTGGLAGWWSRLQEMAEKAKQEAEKNTRNKNR